MADLTGDGVNDLFTGCFEGGIYVLAGKQGGDFAAPEQLLDRAGNILRLGQYWDYEAKKWTGVEGSQYKDELGIGAAAVDWDDDGDLDLVLGSFQGKFYLRLNEGSSREPAFATESIVLAQGDQPLEVAGGDVIPEIADWDGDGRFDILSGSGRGGVYWLRNVGTTKGQPMFATPVAIVGTIDPKPDGEPTGPAMRTQVCVTDYDDDGDLDLLVGDYYSTPYEAGEAPERHGWVWLLRRQ